MANEIAENQQNSQSAAKPKRVLSYDEKREKYLCEIKNFKRKLKNLEKSNVAQKNKQRTHFFCQLCGDIESEFRKEKKYFEYTDEVRKSVLDFIRQQEKRGHFASTAFLVKDMTKEMIAECERKDELKRRLGDARKKAAKKKKDDEVS